VFAVDELRLAFVRRAVGAFEARQVEGARRAAPDLAPHGPLPTHRVTGIEHPDDEGGIELTGGGIQEAWKTILTRDIPRGRADTKR